MFGWRRRSEGFEWKDYVRTTVLVRRADRQRRIEERQAEALDRAKHVRDRGLAAGHAGLESAADQAAHVAQKAGQATLTLSQFCVAVLRDATRPMVSPAMRFGSLMRERLNLRLPRVNMPDVRGHLFLPRWVSRAPQAVVATAIFAAAIFVGGPILRGDAVSLPGLPNVSSLTATIAVPAMLKSQSTDVISGRASVVSGDQLRIGGQLVRLNGITAPEVGHPCVTAKGRSRNCAAAARQALERFVGGRAITCSLVDASDDGVTRADCSTERDMLALVLLRDGFVFADDTAPAAYRTEEDAARNERLGIWQGETVRPGEWRARVWEEAKRGAPDGCPVKAYSKSSRRYYVMPWAANYGQSEKRSAKIERWFCSEDEARSAGYVSMAAARD
jgi:endonuclease YncB( thermonuclease family)